MGGGEWGTGNREEGMGNGEWGTGNGEWGWGIVFGWGLWYNGRHLREVTEVKILGAVVREDDFPSHGYAQ